MHMVWQCFPRGQLPEHPFIRPRPQVQAVLWALARAAVRWFATGMNGVALVNADGAAFAGNAGDEARRFVAKEPASVSEPTPPPAEPLPPVSRARSSPASLPWSKHGPPAPASDISGAPPPEAHAAASRGPSRSQGNADEHCAPAPRSHDSNTPKLKRARPSELRSGANTDGGDQQQAAQAAPQGHLSQPDSGCGARALSLHRCEFCRVQSRQELRLRATRLHGWRLVLLPNMSDDTERIPHALLSRFVLTPYACFAGPRVGS